MIVSFDEYKKKKQELYDYEKKIYNLIDQFIEIDPIKNRIRKPFLGVYDFYNDNQRRGGFTIRYSYDDRFINRSDELELTHKEYLRLVDFMKDPEEYKLKMNTDKYNL